MGELLLRLDGGRDIAVVARFGNLGSEVPMSKHTSVRLDEHFQTFIAGLLREGRYRSANQVVCAGLALLEHQTKLEVRGAASPPRE